MNSAPHQSSTTLSADGPVKPALKQRPEVTAIGVRRSADGGTDAAWALSWPEQQAAGTDPIFIRAMYGASFHHPHLRGGTVGDWPLNVFDQRQAAAELPTLRAITSADIRRS
jgi:hypothetical protein